MSVDGKIADMTRSPARFGSKADKHHLEAQIAQADGVLFGAGTLRTYGTTLPITSTELLEQRQQQNQPPQPIHIVCSQSGILQPNLRFFQQKVPRWLLTTKKGAQIWSGTSEFERVLVAETQADSIDWGEAFASFYQHGMRRLAVLGGGQLIAALTELDVIDELHLTICPLILGGRDAPTLVEGNGFSEALAPRLELVSMRSQDHELFLHYRVCHSPKQIDV